MKQVAKAGVKYIIEEHVLGKLFDLVLDGIHSKHSHSSVINFLEEVKGSLTKHEEPQIPEKTLGELTEEEKATGVKADG